MTQSLFRSSVLLSSRRPIAGLLAGALLVLVSACAAPHRTLPRASSTGQATPSVTAPGPGVATSPSTMPQNAAATQIGLLLPLSGPQAALGQALLDAANIAYFQMNDPDVALMPRDTGGTPSGAAAAARQAIDEGADVLIGPVFAGEVTAAGPVARQAGISLVSFSTDRSVAGRGVYVMGFLPELQVERVVSYAVRNGRTRVAAVVPGDALGDRISAGLQQAIARSGGTIAEIEKYDPADSTKTLAVANLTPGTYDALLLPGSDLVTMARAAEQQGINGSAVQLLGSNSCDDPQLLQEPSVVGMWCAAPNPADWEQFVQTYQSVHQAAPLRLTSLAYDATRLAIVLARQGASFGPETLTQAGGFSGIDGIFRFRPEGTIERGLAILEVQPGRFAVREPAPQSFNDVIY